LLAAIALGEAGLLVRKERNRVAQDSLFGEANFWSTNTVPKLTTMKAMNKKRTLSCRRPGRQ
jgi:hypothetical protein